MDQDARHPNARQVVLRYPHLRQAFYNSPITVFISQKPELGSFDLLGNGGRKVTQNSASDYFTESNVR